MTQIQYEAETTIIALRQNPRQDPLRHSARGAAASPRHSAQSEAELQNRAPVASRRWLNAFPAGAGPLSAIAALPQCGIPLQLLRRSARCAVVSPRHSAQSEAELQNRAPVASRRWLNAFPAGAGPLSATAALPQCGIPLQPLRHSAQDDGKNSGATPSAFRAQRSGVEKSLRPGTGRLPSETESSR